MFLSAIKAMKWFSNCCVGFLVSIVDTTKRDKVKLEEVPVVNEFIDVFPKDLPGIPADHKVTFEIKLILGTMPISKASYLIAPANLKELHTKL